MTQETIKWKLFSFSLLGRAKQLYAHTVGGIHGNWDELHDKFCLAFFPLSRIATLQIELLTFQQKEKETLGAAWARFLSLINTSPNLSLPDHVHLYHFHLGLRKEAALQLDVSSGGSFTHKIISEGKAILEKILENTPYTGIYDEFPKETVESSPDQQEEAHAIESKTSSNPSHDSVARKPPIEGTHDTSGDDEPHPSTFTFEIKVDPILGNITGNEELDYGISKDYLSVWSSQSLNTTVESKSALDLRGELMSISITTMTYSSLGEDMNCHEKESALPEIEDFINEHGSYFLTIPSNPSSYEKSLESIYNSTITCKINNPFLVPVNKIFEKVAIDAFVYHKFCKFRSVFELVL